jgi:hypothetical protein
MSLDEAVAQGIASVGQPDVTSPEVTVTDLVSPEMQDRISAGQREVAEEMALAQTDLFDELQRQDFARQQAEIDQGVVSPTTDPEAQAMISDLADYNRQFTGPEFDPSATGFQEAYDRNLAEDVDLLGDLLGDEDQDGDNVVVEAQPKPDPETEPPVEERTPRPFEILPFAASTPFTPRTQYGQIVPVTRTQFARPGGIADLQRQLAILNRRLFT